MPTVMRIGSYRFFFYSNDSSEPAHIHIQREQMLAKFWLKPVLLTSSTRFSPKRAKKIGTIGYRKQRYFFGGVE